MGRKRSGKRARRGGRSGGTRIVRSVIVTTMNTTADFGDSQRAFSMKNLIQDISEFRAIVLKRVEAKFTLASATGSNPGAFGQIRLHGVPFEVGSAAPTETGYASMQWKGLSATNPTKLSVAPKLPGQMLPIMVSASTTAFTLNATSKIVATWSIEIVTSYQISTDTAITVFA